jgi:hypothetical protein
MLENEKNSPDNYIEEDKISYDNNDKNIEDIKEKQRVA